MVGQVAHQIEFFIGWRDLVFAIARDLVGLGSNKHFDHILVPKPQAFADGLHRLEDGQFGERAFPAKIEMRVGPEDADVGGDGRQVVVFDRTILDADGHGGLPDGFIQYAVETRLGGDVFRFGHRLWQGASEQLARVVEVDFAEHGCG